MPSLASPLAGPLAGLLTDDRTTDADAALVIAALTSPSQFTQRLVNRRVIDLKAAGIWSRLDCYYDLAMPNQADCLVNWILPGTRNLTANGSVTHVPNKYMAGDGVSANLATGYTPGGTLNYKQDDAFVGAYLHSYVDNNIIVGQVSGTSRILLLPRPIAGTILSRLNDETNQGGTFTDTTAGLVTCNRAASGTRTLRSKGALLSTNSVASVGLPSGAVTIFRSVNTYTANRASRVMIGGGLTDDQQASLRVIEDRDMLAIGAAA